MSPIHVRLHDNISLQQPPVLNHIFIADEYDGKLFEQVFSTHDRVLVLGDVAGAGKSFCLKQYIRSKNHVFVCPTNLLGREAAMEDNGLKVCTLFHLTGYYFSSGMEEKKREDDTDYSEGEVVVFDEIYNYGCGDLLKVREFIDNHPHIHYYATGDVNQNRPINDITISNYKQYYNNIIYALFPNIITLHISKRLRLEEDKVKMLELKKDLFDTDRPLADIARQYFKVVDGIEEGFGVSYLNDTAIMVNEHMHLLALQLIDKKKRALVEGLTLHKGVLLRARAFIGLGFGKSIHTNYTYKVRSWDDETVKIEDVLTGEKYRLSHKNLKNFTFTYAGTGHSTQGITVDGKVIVYDVGFGRMTREWFYTAVSRTRLMSDTRVCFFQKSIVEGLEGRIIRKIEGHKKADIKEGRSFVEEEFVNLEWVMKELGRVDMTCERCKSALGIRDGGKQFSINRLDNNLPHIQTNCNIICLHCNISIK
jgi:hypothetical protein